VVSLFVLIKSSDWFVASAEKIGLSLGISPFIIGVTVVAFGTSLPELASSIASVQMGSSEIVAGNVVGSNITNILLIIGITAFLGKGIKMKYNIIDKDIPLLIISAFFIWLFSRDASISILETILLLAGLVIFLISSFNNGEEPEEEKTKVKPITYILLVIGGVLIYFSSEYTVIGLKGIAETMAIKKEIISLGALALGTSLPELVVSVAAIRRNNHGIAVGNVLGSNIFNSYAVVGIASLFGPLTITPDITQFSIPIMLAATILFSFMSISGKIGKWEGFMLLLLYVYFIRELTLLAPV
jgi:cation:H+ antiporter